MSFLIITGNPEEAHRFYHKHIYEDNKDLEILCKQHDFKTRSPYNWKWELFSAILVGDKAKDADKGADLINYEVKSAKISNNAFEYQYHPDSWPAKIAEDKKVSHLCIIYNENYTDIVVRTIAAEKILAYFQEWEKELPTFWLDEKEEIVSNKRFRKSIPFSVVAERGKIICVIKNTKLIYSDIRGIDSNLLLKPVKTR